MTQLTKREQIAAMAMQALLSGKAMEHMHLIANSFGMSPSESLVSYAVMYADALIAELEKEYDK